MMNGKFHRSACAVARRWMLCFLLGLIGNVAAAQWTFLGPQWLGPDSVNSQAIALNHERQVMVASLRLGAAQVQRYDGAAWQPLGSGLPTTGQVDCGLATDEDGLPLLVLGPALTLYEFGSGNWLPVPGLPNVTAALQPKVLATPQDGRIWLAWWQAGATDSTFVWSNRGGGSWFEEGAFPGKLNDAELNESGYPIVLLEGGSAPTYFDGTAWVLMPALFHADEDYIALAVSQDGTGAGVAVLRRDSSDALSVELFSNGNWAQLGPSGFVNGDLADLAMDPSGILHLLSVHHATQGLPQVRRYVAATWQLLGGQSVYNNTVSQPMLAFDPGAAFVVFQDDEQSMRNSVMYLGSPVGLAATTTAPPLAIFPNPAVDRLQLRLPHPMAGGSLQLRDGLGRECGSWALGAKMELEISVAHLPAGSYTFVLREPRVAPTIAHLIIVR